MVELWFNNPKILLENLNEFFLDKDLKYNNNINALIRFSIYYSILIIILNYNIKYLYLSLILIIISYIFGKYNINESFENKNNCKRPTKDNINESFENKNNCKRPTKDNPFMNLTLGDLITKTNMNEACKYDDVKEEIQKNFRKDLFTDTSDIWGKYISDRNFYTMPSTEIINKQKEFAEWLYGDGGKCKNDGNCLKNRDSKFHRGRIINE